MKNKVLMQEHRGNQAQHPTVGHRFLSHIQEELEMQACREVKRKEFIKGSGVRSEIPGREEGA